MSKLIAELSKRGLPRPAKALIILDHLGGRATTGSIADCGKRNGVRDIRDWNMAATLNSTEGRVTRVENEWLLLDGGREYLAEYSYVSTSKIDSEPNSVANDDAEASNAAIKKAVAKAPDGPLTAAICHGHAKEWLELKEFLEKKLGLNTIEFNSRSIVGVATKERLEEMKNEADIAFVLMTAEDETADGKFQARMNVIHEVGFFQGALGFRSVAVMLEDGCEEFSNIYGIGELKFPPKRVRAVFEDTREFVELHLKTSINPRPSSALQ